MCAYTVLTSESYWFEEKEGYSKHESGLVYLFCL